MCSDGLYSETGLAGCPTDTLLYKCPNGLFSKTGAAGCTSAPVIAPSKLAPPSSINFTNLTIPQLKFLVNECRQKGLCSGSSLPTNQTSKDLFDYNTNSLSNNVLLNAYNFCVANNITFCTNNTLIVI